MLFEDIPAKLWRSVAEVDRAVADASDPDDLYAVWERLHRAAAEIAPVDAFYVCLYDPEDETLHFVYNFDDDIYDDPVTLPLGDGPTSWVVRNQRAFLLRPDTRPIQQGGVQFGETERNSASAVHLPMRAAAAAAAADRGGAETLIGVLSAQSYREHAYEDWFVDALQALADRTADGIQRERERIHWHTGVIALARQLEEQRRQITAQSEAFVQSLFEMGREIDALLPLLPPEGSAPLRDAVADLRRSCHRRQSQIHQFPRRTPPPPPMPPEQNLSSLSLLPFTLTEREREMLDLLASGATNVTIAAALGVSLHTVKFHLGNLYGKLGVHNRAECIQRAVAAAKTEKNAPNH